MEPTNLPPSIEDYFIDDELLSDTAFQKKVLPINIFSFKHRKFQMELFEENKKLPISKEPGENQKKLLFFLIFPEKFYFESQGF